MPSTWCVLGNMETEPGLTALGVDSLKDVSISRSSRQTKESYLDECVLCSGWSRQGDSSQLYTAGWLNTRHQRVPPGTTRRRQLLRKKRKKTSLIDIHCVFYRASFPHCHEAAREPLPDAKKMQAPFSWIPWPQEPWVRQTLILH